jgi:hypothetical protein
MQEDYHLPQNVCILDDSASLHSQHLVYYNFGYGHVTLVVTRQNVGRACSFLFWVETYTVKKPSG